MNSRNIFIPPLEIYNDKKVVGVDGVVGLVGVVGVVGLVGLVW